ncbi:hypothetical protein LCGC14_1116590 [marine sediment metagenome]|uniref:Uncharacterized protein n=1 Tax=marine sediment metagenome TaxID=412755 RepID=A0A0F9M531_9ZZZZ
MNLNPPVVRDPDRKGGEPLLAGTGLFIYRLMAHVGWAFDEEAKKHPGTPYNLSCVLHRATRDYCEDFPYVSFHQAEEAIGYIVKQLFALALRRKATVLEKAFPLMDGTRETQQG